MSRLDKFITRLETQRLLLDAACSRLTRPDAPSGIVVELGLGNGRTYHHLRERLPGRRIVAFDRSLVAHPRSHPRDADLILGDIRETAHAFAARHGAVAALVHADLGDGTEAGDADIMTWLPAVALALLRPHGELVSSTAATAPGLALQPLPAGTPDYEYYRYSRGGA